MTYKLGAKSLSELNGVDPRLVRVVKRAIQITEQDFTVFDGLRSAQDQNALYRRGASQKDGYSNIGKHQVQDNGFGHAVDLVPWINGRVSWDWPAIYVIADAMIASARQEAVLLRWGGCWGDIPVNQLNGSPENLVAGYVKRKRDQGKRAFNDGPHWEIFE